jgi:hypothetical protein
METFQKRTPADPAEPRNAIAASDPIGVGGDDCVPEIQFEFLENVRSACILRSGLESAGQNQSYAYEDQNRANEPFHVLLSLFGFGVAGMRMPRSMSVPRWETRVHNLGGHVVEW